ncbi:hypothetical protein FQN54_005897 [Arachnomyces sp. PD_36]|nr:hypothetical protein FQN54_005897 [Arachnomyces sp. PD_36]
MNATSKSPMEGNDGPSRPGEDFSTLVSVVSKIYSRTNSLKFSTLTLPPNERELSPLGEGSPLALCYRKVKYRIPSFAKPGKYEERDEALTLKTTRRTFSRDGSAIDPDELRRILMEIQVLDHPPLYLHENIVTLLGIRWHCEQLALNPAVQPQLVLERVEWTLEDFLFEHEDLPLNARFRIDLDMINGMEALHRCNLIHGDINPRNVLIKRLSATECEAQAKEYTAKLANFGNAFLDNGIPQRFDRATPDYAAPEALQGLEIRNYKAVDIYSLGVTMWRSHAPKGISTATLKSNSVASADGLEALQTLLSTTELAPEAFDVLLDTACTTLFGNAVSQFPEERNLMVFKDFFLSHFKGEGLAALESKSCDYKEPELFSNQTVSMPFCQLLYTSNYSQIHINFQAFNHAAGQVKDQLVASLEHIAGNSDDGRNARALYGLGICHISKFGDPNKLNVSSAMRCITQAAEKGEMAAKAYINRLLDASSIDINSTGLTPAKRTQWLREAAVEGYEVAYADFTENGDNIEKKMEVLRLRWQRRCQYPLTEDLGKFKNLIASWSTSEDPVNYRINSFEDSVLHWAAEFNLTEHLRFLVQDTSLHIDCQNTTGNTPLIAACAAGQLKAALFLIDLGANVSSHNNQGETALHYIWRFCDEEAVQLLRELTKQGIDVNKESKLPDGETVRIATEKDPLPLLPGRAIERVAGRGRTGILRELLQLKSLFGPSDHGAICQMVFWASVLNFSEIRDLLTRYCERNEINATASIDRSLYSPDSVSWGPDGQKRNSMVPVAKGWLSASGAGWATPEIFWRLCCHGSQWESKLKKTILSTSISSKAPLCRFEDVLFFSCPMRHTAFSRVFLKLYIDEHKRAAATHAPKRGHSCVKHKNPGEKWCGFDMDVPSGAPRSRVPLIERILFRNKRTLVQYSIILGERDLFSVLVKDFDANVTRPWSDTSPALESSSAGQAQNFVNNGKTYVNCYTLLALHSQDIWFA